MRRLLIGMLLALCTVSNAFSVDKVTLMADWHSTDPYYVAFATGISKGFFSEEGIEVSITAGKGSSLSSMSLEYGRTDFAIVAATSLLVARNKGMPIVAVMQLTEKLPHALFCRKELGVLLPEHLVGKSVIYSPSSSRSLSLQGYLKQHGLWGKMQLVSGGGTAYSEVHFFLDSKVDCIIGTYYMTAPLLKGKMPYTYFPFYEGGLKLPHQVIAVRQETIRRNPLLIKRFLKATLRSFKYSRDNIEESLLYHNKMYPEVETSVMKPFFIESATYMYPERTGGKIKKELLENAVRFLLDTGQLKGDVDIKSSYTNELLQ